MRLIDADALRAVVLDPQDPHTRWQRYHDVPALIDAALTIRCETCRLYMVCASEMEDVSGEFRPVTGCSLWEAKEPQP